MKKEVKVAKKKTQQKKSKQDDSKLFAFLAVLLSVVGFIIALIAKKKDKYVMFYAKQSLVLFITAIIIGVINKFIILIPILGDIIKVILTLSLIIIWVIALINSLSGQEKETLAVGHYARGINL